MWKDLAYLTGVLQGDGCLYKYKINDRGIIRTRHTLMLEAKDLEMVQKSKEIFEKIFNRKRKIYKKSRGLFGYSFHVKTLLDKFKELDLDFKDPPRPPRWVKNNIELFGPYLAGLIDADGSICIKRKSYPRCKVEISSGSFQKELIRSIKKNFNCGVNSYERLRFNKHWNMSTRYFSLEFHISMNNFNSISQYVLPNISIPRKRNVIDTYYKLREWDLKNKKQRRGFEPR